MIQVENISKVFGSVRAVQDVSFKADNGRITGLLGPNGAGKSTTLRMLATVLRPDAGRLTVDGTDVLARPREARLKLGVLPHNSGLYPRLTARENIRYYGRLYGMEAEKLEARIEEVLRLLDMQAIADRRTQGFSQGERTKVALARALVHEPPNIVLDEPTNGLDVMATRALREVIRRLRDTGHCVLFSSHVMQEIAALCDHIIIIAHGRLVAQGSPDQIRRQTGHEDLEEAFVTAIGGLEGLA